MFLKSVLVNSVFNPFVPNAPFLYHLKTSEHVSGVEKGCIGNKWAKLVINLFKFTALI